MERGIQCLTCVGTVTIRILPGLIVSGREILQKMESCAIPELGTVARQWILRVVRLATFEGRVEPVADSPHPDPAALRGGGWSPEDTLMPSSPWSGRQVGEAQASTGQQGKEWLPETLRRSVWRIRKDWQMWEEGGIWK